MKKRRTLIVVFAGMFLIFGCFAADKPQKRVGSITAAELSGMLQHSSPPEVIDTGSLLQWQDGHIPASRCVPCDASPEAVSTLLPNQGTPLVLYGNASLSEKTCPLVSRLAREGKRPVLLLSGGLAAWRKQGLATETLARIPRLPVWGMTMAELPDYRVNSRKPLIIDVRGAAAVAAGSIVGAVNIPLGRLHERYGEIPLDRPVVVAGEDGSQSLLAASFLLRKGVPVVARLQGDIKGVPVAKGEGGERP